MADVTVKRTEDFEPTFRGGMLKARAGLGVTSFGMQILRLPANLDRYPEHDHAHDGQEEVYSVLEGTAVLTAGGEEHQLEPGVFARVGPSESRKLATGERPPTVLVLGRRPRRGLPGHQVHRRGRAGPARWLTSRVKRLDEFEAIFGGGMLRVRAGLGVSSFGIAVMELPANFSDYPEHDQAHDHQEEVYTAALRPGDAAGWRRGRRGDRARARRLGAGGHGREAQDCHRRRARPGPRGRGLAGQRVRAARVHRTRAAESARSRPSSTATTAVRKPARAAQRNRSSSAGR